MRLVPTGRATEVVEVYATQRCEGCQGVLASPHVLIGQLPCSCVEGGHRTLRCLGCDTMHYEPPHDSTSVHGIATAYG